MRPDKRAPPLGSAGLRNGLLPAGVPCRNSDHLCREIRNVGTRLPQLRVIRPAAMQALPGSETTGYGCLYEKPAYSPDYLS